MDIHSHEYPSWIQVQNIAYSKIVTVVWGTGSSWAESQQIKADYSSGPGRDGYEVWKFAGTAVGATRFYVVYEVGERAYAYCRLSLIGERSTR